MPVFHWINHDFYPIRMNTKRMKKTALLLLVALTVGCGQKKGWQIPQSAIPDLYILK